MRFGRFVLTFVAIVAVAPSVGATAPARRTVRIPSGLYRPLYFTASQQPVRVASFLIDRDPVTRGEYLGARAGIAADARRPITGINWHEASAFCQARGGRLPTLAEWEYVAAASSSKRMATGDPAFVQALVTAYSSRPSAPPVVDRGTVNAYGARGMHDLVWEWVADPNEAIAALRPGGAHHSHVAGDAHDASCAGAALGAADTRDYPGFLRAAVRAALRDTTAMGTLGFRCAY
jgi:sulfatase modifying factor 1